FLSLTLSKIPSIHTTAVYSAIGASITCLLSLTFIPAMLASFGKREIAFRVGASGRLVKSLENLGRWATSHQLLLYIVTAGIVLVSLVGMRRIDIEVDYFHFFDPHSETSIGLVEINKRLSGGITFEIIVEGKEPHAVESTDILRRIQTLQEFAEKQRDASGQGIDRALSVVDFVKHLNRAFHNDDQQFHAIPSDENVLQELLGQRDQMRGFISEDGQMARVLVRSTLYGSQSMAAVIRRVQEKGKELLPEFRIVVTGTFVLLNRTSDRIAGHQVQSITIALVTIYLVLTLLFRSLRVGLTALAPNLIPV